MSTLSEALAAGRERGRPVMLVATRHSCGASRAVVEKQLAKEELSEYVEANLVLVAVDLDESHDAVGVLIQLQGSTPLIAYLDGDGKRLLSTAGGRPAAVLLNDMVEAVGLLKRSRK
jgi:hypothetical protein